MNLYILRHASAGNRRPNPLLDVRRPLDKEGKDHCLRLAHVLNALKVTFDLVISSPLKRSLQTAQLVATETGYEAAILLSKGLAPEATFADFQALLQQLSDRENLLMVGHSPNLQMFLGSLLTGSADGEAPSKIPQIRLRKGTIARLSITRNAQRSSVTLTSVLDPRMVRALYATSTKSSRRKTSRK
jgi:phosphohistidine phosphatase